MPVSSVLSQDDLLNDLPEWIQDRLSRAGKLADMLDLGLYLVGGIVRDLMLGRPTTDVDLMVEGDGSVFSERLSRIYTASLKRHSRFGTATLTFPDGTKMDIATARSERYDVPAALPVVRNDTFRRDLKRRDFTVNAMAICLNEDRFGHSVDPCNGVKDIEAGLIRVLHPQSFVDDPTRLFRAIRFEQRLRFTLAPETLQLFREAVQDRMIDQLSDDRLREQLRLILKELDPWPAVARLDELGALAAIASELHATEETHRLFTAVTRWRDTSDTEVADTPAVWELYLLGMAAPCLGAVPKLIQRMKLQKEIAGRLRRLSDMHRIEQKVVEGLITSASGFYSSVHTLPPETVFLTAITHPDNTVRQMGISYYQKHRHMQLPIDGHTLKSLGIPEGPVYGKILNTVLLAMIDGYVKTKQDASDKALVIWENGEQ